MVQPGLLRTFSFRELVFGLGLINNFDLLCLQLAQISLLLFKLAISGWKRIQNFSLMQSWHFPLTGEYGLARSTIFHVTECSIFRVFKSQIWVLREVWFASGSLNEFLCTPSLALNVVEVKPMQVLVFYKIQIFFY